MSFTLLQNYNFKDYLYHFMENIIPIGLDFKSTSIADMFVVSVEEHRVIRYVKGDVGMYLGI